MMQKDEQLAVSINKRYIDILQQSVLSHEEKLLMITETAACAFFPVQQKLYDVQLKCSNNFQTAPKSSIACGLARWGSFFEHGKVFGDGVNVASRVQSLGIANSILFLPKYAEQDQKSAGVLQSVSLGRFHF